MMFAVITDIYGNSPAIKAVLKDIDRRQLDHIYCLGDIVGIGPDSNEVLDVLTSRKDISYVVGNHDLAVIAAFYGEEPPAGHNNERAHHEWLAARLEPSYISFFENMPKQTVQTYLKKHFYDKPLERYGIVEVKNDEILIEPVEIPYDNRGFLKSYLELEVPEREFILKIFHGGQL